MLLHMLLPLIYTIKCIWSYQPDIFYDTTGYASTLIFVKLVFMGTCRTYTYVHYPFISYEMIQKVRQQRADFNNDQSISKSTIRTKFKLAYYYALLLGYKFNGYFVDYAQANSTWTYEHISRIWNNLEQSGRIVKLYPPCMVDVLLKLEKTSCEREVEILSLAQFRPQKKHMMQIRVLYELKKKFGDSKKFTLNICGTTRGQDDQRIAASLRQKVAQLQLQSNVNFVINQPFSQIQKCLERSHFGIHTMQSQHFGISIVEMLAAGLLVVAHNSAGPKQDIIKDGQFLAQNQQEYVQKLYRIIGRSQVELRGMRARSRKEVERFGEEVFNRDFLGGLDLGQKKRQ